MAGWIELDNPVTAVEGVGGRSAARLRDAFGIVTVRDLLEHYPSQEKDKYKDLGGQGPLSGSKLGQAITVTGVIERWQVVRPPKKRRLVIAKALLRDDYGERVEIPFFNQQWRAKAQPEGTRIAVSGVLKQFGGRWQLDRPRVIETGSGASDIDTEEQIRPTYPATEQMPSHVLARHVRQALDQLVPQREVLPQHLLDRHKLVSFDQALRRIHRPRDLSQVRPARDRLVYDELFYLQVGLQQRRYLLESEAAGVTNHVGSDGLARSFLDELPFKATRAQFNAFVELRDDLGSDKPMHRLLQGDVGSGKTLVAAWTMLNALDNGRQAVLMAPTEVLAEQHLRTFDKLLAPLGAGAPGGPRVELLTSATPQSRLRGLLAEIASGDVQMVIGTHALLEDRVMFDDLGVIVIDEQHRFGVEHRTRLKEKRSDGRIPDVLVMTATPIPRSLALTVYGDLDVTLLDELPPGRQEISTTVIDSASGRRAKMYSYIRDRVALGERAYFVCPLVATSEALPGVASAEETHTKLSTEVFPDLRVGLVHGQMPSAQREETMEAFRAGELQVLVATTVIEVGVDVPEATFMVIEDANRFGLSQLHQLRGRVGRGSAKSYCVLFADAEEQAENDRLNAMAAVSDGFELAEEDLRIRGEGSLFDTRQSGAADLKLARLIRDRRLVQRTRDDAREIVMGDPNLLQYPQLAAEVERRFAEQRLEAMEAG